MKRAEKRRMERNLNKMSGETLEETMKNMCMKYGEILLQTSVEVLNEKYGFGSKRQEDFLNAVMDKLNKKG